MIIKITDHQAQAIDRLAGQFRDTTVENLVALLGDRAQGIEDTAFELIGERSVYEATGSTLEALGRTVGQLRPVTGPAATDDEAYRGLILGRIVINRSNGLSEDLLSLLRLLGAEAVTLSELRPATAVLEFRGDLVTDSTSVGAMTKQASGPVALSLVKYNSDYFGFDGDAAADGFGADPPTFLRSTVAYLDGVSYAASTLRFPSNSGIKGVLVEESTTNLALWSQDFTNAYWTKNRTNITSDYLAPDGTLTAMKMTENTVANATFGVVRAAAIGTPGAAGVFSAYVKAAERSACYIQTNNAGANQRAFFDLATGTVVGTPDLGTAGIEAVGGGWFRIWLATTSVVDGWFKVYMSNSPGVSTYTSDGVSGMYVWGAQVEAKAYRTTYVPTTSATATRAAETLTVPTAGLLVPSQGSVIIETYVNGNNAVATPGAQRTLFGMDGANADRIELRRTTGGVFQAITGNTSGISLATWTNTPTEGIHRYCLAFDAANLVLAADGADRGTTAGPIKVPAALQALMYVNSAYNGLQQWGSPSCRMYFYTRKLTQTERADATLGNYPADFTAYHNFTTGELYVPSTGGALAEVVYHA